MCTYGDGVSDVNIESIIDFHRRTGARATITSVQPGNKFGVLDIEQNSRISRFTEKSKEDGNWINAGFMVLEPEIFDYLEDDSTILERYPFERLINGGTAPWIRW